MTDYQATLFDPVYTIQGVPVTLTLSAANGGAAFDTLTALDKTAGVEVGEQGAQVATIKPAAAFRMVELADNGIQVRQLPNASLQMNDFLWKVVSYRLKPSPRGENDGEVWLILAGRVALDSESESES